VLTWQERWRELPIPNAFLGITEDQLPYYDRLAVARKCAMRWKAHNRQLLHLADALKDRLLVIQYEELAAQTQNVLANLERFLDLSCPITMPEIKTTSIGKWREQLSHVEIEQISAGLNDSPHRPQTEA